MEEFLGDGAAGRLFEVGDIEAMVEGCIEILGDSELRREMGKRGRERVLKSYSEDRVIGQYENLYRRLLDSA